MDKEGKRLAEVVKQTHKKLRRQYREGEDETKIWKEHIQHNKELQTYAAAMHELATTHWEGSHQVNMSRVPWTYLAIKQYFEEGEQDRITQKEMRKLKHLELEADYCVPSAKSEASSRISVLDVGSCYNPFSIYKDLEVTAIDLCPASETVKRCDFLSVQTTSCEIKVSSDGTGIDPVPEEKAKRPSKSSNEGGESKTEQIGSICNSNEVGSLDSEENCDTEKSNSNDTSQTKSSLCDRKRSTCESKTVEPGINVDSNYISALETNSYDVVVFCLFLEYIPSPRQRFQCCEKAYDLLKPNGILCIITPDSKHQNANVHIYKLWKITLGFLGFSRTKYEKQTHFHGMVFRKGLCKRAWEMDAERESGIMKNTQVKSKFATIDYDKVCAEIYIPQDFPDFPETEEDRGRY